MSRITPNHRDPITARALQRGFTLIEMMIVVTIVAIATALALPMFSGTSVTRLRGAADMLAADLAFAQVESMTHADNPRLVVFDDTLHTYRIATAADPHTPITNPVGNQPYETTFGSAHAAAFHNVTIHSYDLDGDDRLQFGPYGEIDQTVPATITLACEGKSLTISIDPILGEATQSDVQ